jgi:hypothetical protein
MIKQEHIKCVDKYNKSIDINFKEVDNENIIVNEEPIEKIALITKKALDNFGNKFILSELEISLINIRGCSQ